MTPPDEINERVNAAINALVRKAYIRGLIVEGACVTLGFLVGSLL